MAMHKLLVDDFNDEPYTLIAFHCNLEDYRLAYFLNDSLNIKLKRSKHDLDFEYTKASYSMFEWQDWQKQISWRLLSNICKKEEEALTSSGSLFQTNNTIVKTYNLIPELEQVNYLLKIESQGNPVNEKYIINKLQEIQLVSTAYLVDSYELKSRNNLIFD